MNNEPKNPHNENTNGVNPNEQGVGKSAHIEKMLGSQSFYVVDSMSAFDKLTTSLVMHNDQKEALGHWIDYMKSTPDGLHKGLENFLIKNPDQFRIDDKSENGVYPKELQRFSRMIVRLSNKEQIHEAEITSVLASVGEKFVQKFKGHMQGLSADYAVDEISPEIDITTRPVNSKISLASWIEYMKSTPNGINEGLEKFLLANPDQLNLDGQAGQGLSPREMHHLSDLLTKIENTEDAKRHVYAEALGSILKSAGPNFTVALNEFNSSRDEIQITSRPVKYEVPLSEWVEMMEKTENGLDPSFKDFLLKNPDLYNPNMIEGDGVTPRSLTLASMILSQPKKGALVAQTLEDLLGKEVLQRFSKHLATNLQYCDDSLIKVTAKMKDEDNTPER